MENKDIDWYKLQIDNLLIDYQNYIHNLKCKVEKKDKYAVNITLTLAPNHEELVKMSGEREEGQVFPRERKVVNYKQIWVKKSLMIDFYSHRPEKEQDVIKHINYCVSLLISEAVHLMSYGGDDGK